MLNISGAVHVGFFPTVSSYHPVQKDLSIIWPNPLLSVESAKAFWADKYPACI